MPNRERPGGLLKIGELAKAAGVSLTTVKFYAKEGLIRASCRTGKNMAWYDSSCEQTIRLIRALQKERFYPLSVIKRLLESGPVDAMELELLDAIQKVDLTSAGAPVTLAEAARRTGLTAAQIGETVRAGLTEPETDRRQQLFSRADLTVLTLARRRLDAGIPFAQTLQAFAIYQRSLETATDADVGSFLSHALASRSVTAEEAARMIRVSDETLDAFIGIRRKALNRRGGAKRIEELGRFEAALRTLLDRVCCVLETEGCAGDARQCRRALAGAPTGSAVLDEAAERYWSVVNTAGGDVARSIVSAARSRDFFIAADPDRAGEAALPLHCLRCCWLNLAEPLLDCGGAAARADAALKDCLAGRGKRAAADRICTILIEAGGNL